MSSTGVTAQPAALGEPSIDDIETRVRAAQTTLMFERSPQPIAAGVLFSPIAALALWPTLGGPMLLAWVVLRVLISSVRLIDLHQLNRDPPPPHRLPARRRRFLWLMAAESASWSALGLLFVPQSSPQIQPVLLASVAVVACVSLFSLASDFFACSLYFTLILVPNGLQQLAEGTPIAWMLGVGLLVIFVILLVESHGLSRRLAELMRLRHEVLAIAEDREQALRVAQHANAAKSRFLATVSHEMRTPLNGILGMAQLMQRSVTDPTERTQVDVIAESGRHLHAVIGDLLDLARIEAGHLTVVRVPFDLVEAVRDVTDLLEPQATHKGLRFEQHWTPGLPARVVGDPAKVRQVLHNLIGNAIKFTASGTIRLDVSRLDDGTTRFTVSDTGIGVPPDQVERIFDAFERLAPLDTATGVSGTGLGLTISRQLARAMGGDLRCEPATAPGAVFRFEVPLSAPEPAPAPTEAGPAANSPDAGPPPLSGHVLVVEDSEINALIACDMLTHLGMTSEIATDGEQALARLETGHYALVLMDCQMPVLDGWEATRRWREREAHDGRPRMPIIAVTANAIRGDRERCLEAGMDDYLAKPIDMDLLARTIRQHRVVRDGDAA